MFINYSRVSIHATEMYDVISMALLSLFLYYQALFFAEVNPSSAVRRGIVYGCSFVMCGFVTTTDIIIDPDTGDQTIKINDTKSIVIKADSLKDDKYVKVDDDKNIVYKTQEDFNELDKTTIVENKRIT